MHLKLDCRSFAVQNRALVCTGNEKLMYHLYHTPMGLLKGYCMPSRLQVRVTCLYKPAFPLTPPDLAL